MNFLTSLLDQSPLVILFSAVALGYIVGKLKYKSFVLGGIAGTLLVGVGLGQLGITIDASIKDIFFALFIYAVGVQGGPQFFRALSLRSLNQVLSAVAMCVVGLFTVLIAAWTFGLDRGTAAGLAAGGLTQSAIIGTAGEAISRLSVSADLKATMEANIAVGYAVCYIFGVIGPILMVTWFIPMVMKWDIRAEAIKLAQQMSGGMRELEAGQYNAAKLIQTRFFQVAKDSPSVGKLAPEIRADDPDFAVEAVVRGGKPIDAVRKTTIEPNDIIAVTGRIGDYANLTETLGNEVPAPYGFQLVEENRNIVLTNSQLANKDLAMLHKAIHVEARRGVFLTGVRRMGQELPVLPKLELHRGDLLKLTGRPKDLDQVQDKVGYPVTAAAVTDFVMLGFGMTIGLLLGLISFKVGGVPVSIGSGGGCLLSGLMMGWLRSTHPRYAALPPGATNLLRDLGLAVFVAVVGISAGPQVLSALQKEGMTLLLLGMAVTLVPQIVVFFFSYYVLRIRNPIEALACLVGGRSANPAFASLLDKAGNGTPVVAFTVTYAVANVLLTLWGPLIIGIITKNPAP